MLTNVGLQNVAVAAGGGETDLVATLDAVRPWKKGTRIRAVSVASCAVFRGRGFPPEGRPLPWRRPDQSCNLFQLPPGAFRNDNIGCQAQPARMSPGSMVGACLDDTRNPLTARPRNRRYPPASGQRSRFLAGAP